MALRTRTPSPRRLLATAFTIALVAVGCGAPPPPSESPSEDDTALEDLAPDTLHWVTPLAVDEVYANEPTDVTVYTQRTDVWGMHFAVDGVEVGVCDASDPEQDCVDGDNWTWSVAFDTVGTHRLTASFTDATGATVQTEREVTVLAEPAVDPADDPSGGDDENDPYTADQQVPEGAGQIVQGINPAIGYTDPSEPTGPATCHRTGARSCSNTNAHGCESWSVQGSRVILSGGRRLDGSVSEIDRCIQDFGASIQRYADLRYVSRASIAAWLAATGNCDPGIHWNRNLMSGARCVATARALGLHLSAADCVARMNDTGHDFAIELAAEFLHRTVHLHHRDPVLIAAYLHRGAHPQRGDINNWCAGSGASSGGFITDYVAAYNAYRTWRNHPPHTPRGTDTTLSVGYAGWGHTADFGLPAFNDLWSRTSGVINPRICHAYPRFDVMLPPDPHTHSAAFIAQWNADNAYFLNWVDAAHAAGCEIGVALKADNQQYTPGHHIACTADCASGETCGTDGRCEAHRIPKGDEYARGFRALMQMRRPSGAQIRVFSTWNEPNNNGGLESRVKPAVAADFYLRARRMCRPQDRCYVAAGDFASWYTVDANHNVTLDWLGGVGSQCHGTNTDDGCVDGGYLDQFKYWVVNLAPRYHFRREFRPEFIGFHPWRDILAHGLRGDACTQTGTCFTRAILGNLGGLWAGAQLWATEAGLHSAPDATQQCDATFAMQLLALSPRITRFYFFDAHGVADGSHPLTMGVLRDRLESAPGCP